MNQQTIFGPFFATILLTLALYLFATQRVDATYVGAAWVFVVFRMLHSLLHCTLNLIKLRFFLYACATASPTCRRQWLPFCHRISMFAIDLAMSPMKSGRHTAGLRHVEIGVLELLGNSGRVRAISLRQINGEPEPSIELRIHARRPLSDSEAKKVARRYVNVLQRP